MAAIDPSKYSHSPIHKAVVSRDYAALQRELSSLPRLADPSSIRTEAASIAEEERADAISAVIDRRDVPNRETPLHLAVRQSDPTAAEMLMAAGADWGLQSQQGWNALQEAICAGKEDLVGIIVRHHMPRAWAKWWRRLPRVVGSMRRVRDFYMEITFHFESSVIPFISRVAPSDTYKIWKRGSNLRADMTLAGFDGLRIKRSDQSVLFLGEGSEDGKVPPGALCIVSHKNKDVMNALEGSSARPTDAEVENEVSAIRKAEILRPGIDVTKAVLLPQMTWRRQERRDTVGPWKAKVFDMHHVVFSLKRRQVPGASTMAEASSSNEEDIESKEYHSALTEEERKQLEAALEVERPDEALSDGYVGPRHSCYDHKHDELKKIASPRRSLGVEKACDLFGASPHRLQSRRGRPPVEVAGRGENCKGAGKRDDSRKSAASSVNQNRQRADSRESEYKKGLRPSLWLSPSFPLQTEELLPLLDILGNKVKAIRRLRELLATKLPPGTFPVKVSIPVVPTVRVLVTFTKFEELRPPDDFSTPPSSPGRQSPKARPLPSSWRRWMKAPHRRNYTLLPEPGSRADDTPDPFTIPPDYAWITPEAKKRRVLESRRKSNEGKRS